MSVVASAPVSNPMGSGDESDPDHWWFSFLQSAEALAQLAPAAFESIAAIAITGATRTMVALDRKGGVLFPASTFRDARAAEHAAALSQRIPATYLERSALNAFHPVARLIRMRAENPTTFADIAHVVDPKDFINFKLTGVIASDAISSARLAAAAEPVRDGASLIELVGLPAGLVPPLLSPTSVVDGVRADLPGVLARLVRKPVLTMAHDSWSAVLGLGALRDGRAYNLSGTTEVFGIVSHRGADAEGLLRVDWGSGLFQLGGPSLAGGDTLNWALNFVGRSHQPVAEALDAVFATPRGPRGLLVLPHLSGERVPFWNPDLRGAVLGLARAHGPSDLVRASLEGVAFLNRLVLTRAEAALGVQADEIRFGGGGAGSAAWAQIKADITGRQVCVTASPEPGLTGCGLAALVALGIAPDLDRAQERYVTVARRFAPTAEGMAAAEPLYRIFEQAEAVLAPLSEALAHL